MLNTPIAELGFTGIAIGAALMGMRPIADMQYSDFLFLASDQLINNAAKMRYMSGGTAKVPLVSAHRLARRARFATRAKHGALLYRRAGFESRCASNAYDAKGLLRRRCATISGNDVRAQVALTARKARGASPAQWIPPATSRRKITFVRVDKAARPDVKAKGVTILAWLLMVHYAIQAANETNAEVIDVRSCHQSIGETIGASVTKTGPGYHCRGRSEDAGGVWRGTRRRDCGGTGTVSRGNPGKS